MSDEMPQFQDRKPADFFKVETSAMAGKSTANFPRNQNAEWPKKGADGRYRDRCGQIFDPMKHRQYADGVPVVGQKGYFRSIPDSLRPSGSQTPEATPEARQQAQWQPQQASEAAQTPPPAPTPPPPLNLPPGILESTPGASSKMDMTAQQVAAMEEMLALAVFGEEWKLADDERKALVAGWVSVFKVKGVVDMPWWMEIAATHGLIIAPRIHQPKTKSKLATWGEKLRGMFKRKAA